MDTQPERSEADMVRTTVMLKADTHDALWDLSRKQDRPFSRIVRAALEEYVRQVEAAA